MDKIELTDLQKQLIQKQLNEKYDPFMATEEELDNYNGDMIAWFWAKYQEQEQKEQ